MVTHFDSPKAGEWVRPVRRGYLFACCDCGLVHRMDTRAVRLVNGKRGKKGVARILGKRFKVEFRVFRADGETKKLRKKDHIKVRQVSA